MYLKTLLKNLGPSHYVDGRSRQQRLYEALRKAILDGELFEQESLPSTRMLASLLGVARNSVIFAYDRLRSEGFLMVDKKSTKVATLPSSLKNLKKPNHYPTTPRISQRGKK